MEDEDRGKEQLLRKLASLHQRVETLEAVEAEYKQVREALRRSEERFRFIFYNVSVGIALVDQHGFVREANEVECNFLAYPREELIGMHVTQFTHPEDLHKDQDLYSALVRGERNAYVIDKRYVRKDGGVVWGHSSVSLIRDDEGQPEYTTIICQDITRGKRAEEELRASERRLDRMLQTMVDGMVMVDAGGEITYANQAAEHILGVRKDGVVGRYYNEREWSQIDEEGKPYPLDQLPVAITLREHCEVCGLEHGVVDPNGEVKWLSVNAAPLINENGELYGAVASFRDITEHKRALQALRAERDRAQKYLDIAGVIIVALDTRGEVTLMNRKGLQVLGYTEEEIVGKNWFDVFLPARMRERVRAVFQDLMAGNIEGAEHFQNPCLIKSGEERIISWHNTVVTNDAGHILGTLSSGEDVTERLKLEDQLRQAQKMEAIGRLTAGIAHDFNNLLTAINGFAELMQLEVRADDPLRESVNKILSSGRRAADLVRQLLAFSRKQIIEPQVLKLNQVVIGLDTMLRRVIGEHIQMETLLSPDLWSVKVDTAQIEQVIVNVVVNARDAMPGGGRLTIETSNITLDEDYAASHLEVQAGDYVLLALSDTGGGMSDEVKAHIFEPFFTTKELGRGTGLGLSTVYGIVKQSGGHIWVYSEENQGTTFKIYLPRAQEVPRPAARQLIPVDIPVGDETILLVEDDGQVRALARRTLERQGYTVLEARDSREAWQVFTGHPGPVHLLLTDVVMPGVSGKSLANQLAEINPDLKVLFMSGYTSNVIIHHGELEEGIAFLQKPLSPAALARKVRQVLDTPRRDKA